MRSLRSVCLLLPLLSACALPEAVRADEPASSSHEPASAPAEASWQELGESVEGRTIRMRTCGYGPRRVLWIGGIHGDEREGHYATQRLAEAFLASSDLPRLVTLSILEDLNPDGSAADRRGNARGVDLNRNFPASNVPAGREALTEPEARVLFDLVQELAPHTVIVVHSWRPKPTGPRQFINYDGPAEDLARIFAAISPRFPVRESTSIAPTPGSLGSWIGKDLGIPILTLEYPRGGDPRALWLETREAILAVIRG